MTKRYVALGSSMAAGPGIPPRDKHAPLRAGRSAANYPHLVAQRLGLDLVDVTYSGATTAHVLTDRQNNEPPQVSALDGSEELVTVTIGGNDVGYIPMLTAAGLPRCGALAAGAGRPAAGDAGPDRPRSCPGEVDGALKEVGRTVRQLSPRARVFFVDYLTVLPPPGEDATPLSGVDAALGRRVAATLERLTAEASAETGCEVVRASDASRGHHAWSADPWTTKPTRYRPADSRPPRPGAPQRGGHARRGRAGHRRKQEIRAAFADHDRRSVGVGARNPRQRRGVGDTEVVDTADAQLLVEGAVGLTAHRDGAGRVVCRDRGFPDARLEVRAWPGRISRLDRGCDRLGGHDFAGALHRPDERIDVLALG